MPKTLGQERAKHALEKIEELKVIDRDCQRYPKGYGKYVSYVSALPASILTSGLGLAMAQLLAQAKGDLKDPHYLLFSHVQSWLCSKRHLFGIEQKNLIDGITQGDEQTYVLAQVEALAYLNWLKKFARAYLKDQQSNNHTSDTPQTGSDHADAK